LKKSGTRKGRKTHRRRGGERRGKIEKNLIKTNRMREKRRT